MNSKIIFTLFVCLFSTISYTSDSWPQSPAIEHKKPKSQIPFPSRSHLGGFFLGCFVGNRLAQNQNFGTALVLLTPSFIASFVGNDQSNPLGLTEPLTQKVRESHLVYGFGALCGGTYQWWKATSNQPK